MKLRHLVPFAILMAWQAAPSGRFRLTFGSGASFYQRDNEWYASDTYCDASCNCSTGAPYVHHGTEDKSYASTGLQVEAWPSNSIRLSGSAGKADKAFFGALQVAWEARLFGVGGGYAHASDSIGASGLSGYLRLGTLEGVHLRGEVLPPSPIWGLGGWSRVGVGYNLGRGPGAGVFIGLARTLGHVALNGARRDSTAVFADLNVPLGSRFDLLLRGHTGLGGWFPWGLGVGARVAFGRP